MWPDPPVTVWGLLRRFYEDHVIRFAGLREPSVEMLVACQRKTMMSIFRSERTIVNYESAFSAVGAGSMYARWLLGQLWGTMIDEEIPDDNR